MNRATSTILLSAATREQFRCLRPLYERLELRRDLDVRVARESVGEPGGTGESDASSREETARLFGVPLYRVITAGWNEAFSCDVLVTAGGGQVANVAAESRVRVFPGVTLPDNGFGLAAEEDIDCFLAAGAFMERQLVASGWLGSEDDARGRIARTGFLPADRLAGTALSRRRELGRWDLDGTRPVVLFAPTRTGDDTLATLTAESLRAVTSAGRCDVIVDLTTAGEDPGGEFARRLAALECPRLRVARDTDRTPLLFLANLVVTDTSTVSNEFVLLDRPIVFLDTPASSSSSSPLPDATRHLEWWARRAGQLVDDPDDAAGAVEEGLRFPEFHSTIRRAMARDLFHRPGAATDAAMAWIDARTRRHSWETAGTTLAAVGSA